MIRAKNILTNESWLVFMFCIAVVAGPAIGVLFQFDLTHFPDAKTYLGLANFEFDQNPVRRYRLIVPMGARVLNVLMGGVFKQLKPSYFTADFSLAFAFFVVNTILTAWFGLLTYKYIKTFSVGTIAAIVGLLSLLTCRYTIYTAALPLVDSLFCVVIAATLLSLRRSDSRMQIALLLIGPFVKESFIFIAPLILLYGSGPKWKLFIWFFCSGLVVFSYRFGYDCLAHNPVSSSFTADLHHLYNLRRTFFKVFSIHSVFLIIMIVGVWVAAPGAVFLSDKRAIKVFWQRIDQPMLALLVSVLVQALLSGSVERMFYLAMPVIVVVIAMSAQALLQRFAESRQ